MIMIITLGDKFPCSELNLLTSLLTNKMVSKYLCRAGG